eukprot:jgi/Mesvir1/13509/Mv18579-RA.1
MDHPGVNRPTRESDQPTSSGFGQASNSLPQDTSKATGSSARPGDAGDSSQHRANGEPLPSDRGSIVATMLRELGRVLPDAAAMMWAPHVGGKALRCTHVLARGTVSSPLMAEVSSRHPMVTKILYARGATVHRDVAPLSAPWAWASLWTLLGDGTDKGSAVAGDLATVAAVRVPFPRAEPQAPEPASALKGNGSAQPDVALLVQHVFRELKQESVIYGILLVQLPPPAAGSSMSDAAPPAGEVPARAGAGVCPAGYGSSAGGSSTTVRKSRRSFESCGESLTMVEGGVVGGSSGDGAMVGALSVEEAQHLVEVVADQLACSLSQVSAVEILGRMLEEALLKSEAEQQAHNQREALEKSRTDFLCIVNHEMRTPMHAIVAACSLLEETPLSAQQRVYVKTINESSTLLGMLVDDVLDVGRLESGSVELDTELFDLGDVLSLVHSLVQPIAMLKNVAVDVAMDPRVPPQVAGDKNRLTQTLLNVISNSVKFTDKGSVSVDVSVLTPEEYGAIMAKCPANQSGASGAGKGDETSAGGRGKPVGRRSNDNAVGDVSHSDGECISPLDKASADASNSLARHSGDVGNKAEVSSAAATSTATKAATTGVSQSGDARAEKGSNCTERDTTPSAAGSATPLAATATSGTAFMAAGASVVDANSNVGVTPSPSSFSSTTGAAAPLPATGGAGARTSGAGQAPASQGASAEEPVRLEASVQARTDAIAGGAPSGTAAPARMGMALTQKQASAQALRELLGDDDEWFFGEQAEEVPPPALRRQAASLLAAPPVAPQATQSPAPMAQPQASPSASPAVPQIPALPAVLQPPSQPQLPGLFKQPPSPGLVKQERRDFGPGTVLRSLSARNSDETSSPVSVRCPSPSPSQGHGGLLRASSLGGRSVDSEESATTTAEGHGGEDAAPAETAVMAPVVAASREVAAGLLGGDASDHGKDKDKKGAATAAQEQKDQPQQQQQPPPSHQGSLRQPQPQRPLDLRALLADGDDDGDEWYFGDKTAPAPAPAPAPVAVAAPAVVATGASTSPKVRTAQLADVLEPPTKQERPAAPTPAQEVAAQPSVAKPPQGEASASAAGTTTATTAATMGARSGPQGPTNPKAVAAAAAVKAIATTMMRESRGSSEDDDEWFVGPLDPEVSPLVGQVITSSTSAPRVYSYDPQVRDAAERMGVKALPVPQRSNTGGVLSRFASSPVITAVGARGAIGTGNVGAGGNSGAMSARQRHASLRHVSTLAANTELLGADDEDEWYVGASTTLQSFSSVNDVIAATMVDRAASQSSMGTSLSVAGAGGRGGGDAVVGSPSQKFASSNSVASASTVSEDGGSSDGGSVVGELVSFSDLPRSKSLAGPRYFTQSNYKTLSQLSPVFQGGPPLGVGLQAQMQMQAQLQAQAQAQAQVQVQAQAQAQVQMQARILSQGGGANRALQAARQGAGQGLSVPGGVMEDDDDDTMYTAVGPARGVDEGALFVGGGAGTRLLPNRSGAIGGAIGGGLMALAGGRVDSSGGSGEAGNGGGWQNTLGMVGGALVAPGLKPSVAAAVVAATAELVSKSASATGRDNAPMSPTGRAVAKDAAPGPGQGLTRQVTAPGQLVRQSSLTFGRRMVSADSEDRVEMMDRETMMQRSNTALSVVEEGRGVQTIRPWSMQQGMGGELGGGGMAGAAAFGGSGMMAAAAAGGCVFARALQQGDTLSGENSPRSPGRVGMVGGMMRQPSSGMVGGGGGGGLMRQPSNSILNAGALGGGMAGGAGGAGLQRQPSSSVIQRGGGGGLQRQPSSSVVTNAGSGGASGGGMQRQSSGSMISGAPTLMAGVTSSGIPGGPMGGGMMQRQPSGAGVSITPGVGGPLTRQASIGKEMVMADSSFVPPPPVAPVVGMQRQKSGVFGWRDTKTGSFIPADSEVAQQVQQHVARAGAVGGGGLTRSHTTPVLFNPSAALPPRPRMEKGGMTRQGSSQHVGAGPATPTSQGGSILYPSAAPQHGHGVHGGAPYASGGGLGGGSMVRSKTMGYGLDSSNHRNLAGAHAPHSHHHGSGGGGGFHQQGGSGGGGGYNPLGGGVHVGSINRDTSACGIGNSNSSNQGLSRSSGPPQEGLHHLRVSAPDASPSSHHTPSLSLFNSGPGHSAPSYTTGGIVGGPTVASPSMSLAVGEPPSTAASSLLRGEPMSDSPGGWSSVRSSPCNAPGGDGGWDNHVLLKVVVKDTGVGLAAEDIPRLFNKFVQADSSTTRQFRGTGLGLSISKRFVALMDGAIWIESEGPGKGSTLTFVIKLLKPAAGADWRRKGVVVDAVTAQEALRDQLVLVCDDNRINRMVTRALLDKAGCRIDMAESGQECLDRLADPSIEQPSVLLLDLCMPDMDGIEVCKRIRQGARAGGKPVPIVVVLTANADNDTKRRCFEAGVDAFMTKPMSLERLTQSLYELLRTYGRDNGRRAAAAKW